MATFLGIPFGSKYPSTQKYEDHCDKLISDFKRFTEFKSSPLLARFYELDQLVHSGEFEKKIQSLKHLKFKNSEEWRQLDQHKALKASSDIKTYLKFIKIGKLKRMEQIAASPTFEEFQTLTDYINSAEFHTVKATKAFKNSEAHQKYQRYKSLKKDTDLKFYHKTIRSNQYKTVSNLKDSDRLKTFFQIEAVVQSQTFLDQKAFLEDKKRFEKSEEAALINEYKTLEKNEEIKWFLQIQKTKPFEKLKKWNLTFEDDFDQLKLNETKWMTGYYWGKALMNDNYVPAGEYQMFTDQNVEIRNSIVKIVTRNESIKGKCWDTTHGFIEKTFDYTSGLISTGQSFRQQYGLFEAKVKFNQTSPAVNAFWLVGEKQTPHIDIFKTAFIKSNAIECALYNGSAQLKKTVKGATFANHYYIYSLEWTKEALIWRINGVEIWRQTDNVPQEPMYLSLCTILPQEPTKMHLPAEMEIDWIKCYQKK
jgi:hypothetical protein